MDQGELVTLCKQGDKRAYRELYEMYSQQMMGVCVRYIGDADLAHDVLHDSFIKVFGSIEQFQDRGEGSLKAWISRIIINTALVSLKKNKELVYVDQIEEYEQYNDGDEDEVNVYESVSNDTILEFIQELPISCRLVFNMFMFENMSHNEIGEQLGINVVSSRVRLTRAKSLLVNKIKEYVEERDK